MLPERPVLAPVLHAVARVVEAHGVLFGVGIAAKDGELLHVESDALQLTDSGLRSLMLIENGGAAFGSSG